ncbi:MAG: hypothetical protein AAFY46_08670 [Planctomycetota bacterium]
MKLADALFYELKMSPSQFRRTLGGIITCRSTVQRYLMGERIPQPHIMVAITRATGGLVQLHDFTSDEPPRCARWVTRDGGTRRMVLPWSKDWPRDELDEPLCPPTSGPPQADDRHADDDLDVSKPVDRALRALGSRARLTPKGHFLLDGRITDNRRIVKAANEVLLSTGQPPIAYPGVETSYD